MAFQPIFSTAAKFLCLLLLSVNLAGCHAEWVSPYYAFLQTGATNMLADVVAWEAHMREAAGTAAADPRNPEVQAKLAAWQGNIEAMSEIEIGIDPGATACDKFLTAVSGEIPVQLAKLLPANPDIAGSGTPQITHCETLPGIFTRMNEQVTGNTAGALGIPFILDQQCKLDWLPDTYFTSLQEGRATAGAPSPARPADSFAKAGIPSTAEEAAAVQRCAALFKPPPGAVHGNLLDSLIIDLNSIIYREEREAPQTTS